MPNTKEGSPSHTLATSQYLPPLAYFCALLDMKGIILEKHEHYIKQSYRNRCYINSANGVLKLTVPIVRKSGKVPMKEVKINYHTKWQNQHWRALESAYRKAPFFDHYADKLHPILSRKYSYLYDLNLDLLSFCLNSLNLPLSITETFSYEKILQNRSIKDIRSAIHPKKDCNNQLFYTSYAYFQVFGSKFVGNLSIVDLLFCEGSRAAYVLNRSYAGE